MERSVRARIVSVSYLPLVTLLPVITLATALTYIIPCMEGSDRARIVISVLWFWGVEIGEGVTMG